MFVQDEHHSAHHFLTRLSRPPQVGFVAYVRELGDACWWFLLVVVVFVVVVVVVDDDNVIKRYLIDI